MRPDHSRKSIRLEGEELEEMIEDEHSVQHAATESIESVESVDLRGYSRQQPPRPERTGPVTPRHRPPTFNPRPTGPHRPARVDATANLRTPTPSGPREATANLRTPTPSGPREATANLRAPTPGRRTGPQQPRSPRRPKKQKIDPNLGRVLGSYRILSLIGEGGMGRVYLAEHTMIGRRVALKLLRPEYAVKKDAVHRFFGEARAVNAIGHENIVDITDYVELDSGETFFIMELLEGQDLSDMLRKGGKKVPLHQAMHIALQVCDALEAAHEKGIIHRDLKPDNIFVVDRGPKSGFVKLLDFGVAKLQGEASVDSSWQTAVGSVIGTPAYMSPEQASGITVDQRTDIYSLGAILYELFTGHPVFRAKSFGEYVVKHMNDAPVPPRDLANAPKIPMALERVILRCLEKDPGNRYQSVNELREDLARATATVETVIHKTTSAPAGERPRRGRGGTIALIVVGIVVLAGGAFWLGSGLTLDDVLGGSTVQPTKTASPPAVDPPRSAAPRVSPLGGGAPAADGSTRPKVAKRIPRFKLRTRPPGAEVHLEGDPKRLGVTPVDDLALPNVGDEVVLVFRLAGYQTKKVKIKVTDSDQIDVPEVQLEPQDTPPRVALKKKRHAKKRHGRRRRGPRRGPNPKVTDPDKGKKPKHVPKKIDRHDTVDPFKSK